MFLTEWFKKRESVFLDGKDLEKSFKNLSDMFKTFEAIKMFGRYKERTKVQDALRMSDMEYELHIDGIVNSLIMNIVYNTLFIDSLKTKNNIRLLKKYGIKNTFETTLRLAQMAHDKMNAEEEGKKKHGKVEVKAEKR